MRLLLGLLLSMASIWLQAQPPRYFKHFGTKEGLSDSRVQAIVQDREGYIWVGTTHGLNRFDGQEFRHFFPQLSNPEYSVHNEVINDLLVDSVGGIWVATQNGLEWRNPKDGKFRRWTAADKPDGSHLPNPTVLDLHSDALGRLWVCTDNRDPCRLDPKTNRFIRYPWRKFVSESLPAANNKDYLVIYYLKDRSPTSFWLHTNVGLFSLDWQTETFAHYPAPEAMSKATAKSACPEAVLMGSWNKDILRFEPCSGQWSRILLPMSNRSPEGERAPDVHAMPGGHLLFGRSGISWLPEGEWLANPILPIEDAVNTLPTGLITDAFQDQEGGLWLGGEEGLWLAAPRQRQWHYQPLADGSQHHQHNTVTSILELPQNGLASLNFYLNYLQFDQGGKSTRWPLQARPGLLQRDAHGRIWLGLGSRLHLLQHAPFSLQEVPIPQNLWDAEQRGYFSDLAQDHEGRLWFAHSEQGLLCFDEAKGTWQKPDSNLGFHSRHVSSLLADHRGKRIWVGTWDHGLYCHDSKTGQFELFSYNEAAPASSISAYMVTDLALGPDGSIIACTDPGGISIILPDVQGGPQFIHLGTNEGLPSGRLTGCVADRHGRIWITSLGGLACLEPKSLSMHVFDQEDGLPTNFLDLAPQMALNGDLLIGLKYGFVRFNPDSLLSEPASHHLRLRNFKIFDQALPDSLLSSSGQELVLNWQQNFFQFAWSSSSPSQDRKLRYAYRLSGFEQRWTNTANRQHGSYTNIPPGKYVLELRSGGIGYWNPVGLRLPIRIVPPFWQTTWFIVLMTLLALSTAWAAYQLRMRQVRHKAELQRKFEAQLARVEMAALRAQMNPHFVFNCLSSINRYILVNQAEAASSYLNKFAKLIRLILDNSKTEFVPLDKEIEALKLYVDMEKMRFDDKFQFEIFVEPGLQPEHLEIPPLLIQPFVENAIWHGLMHKKALGTLQVRITQGAQGLCIEIEDDGIGRAKAAELKSRSAQEHKSHGTQLSADRIANINALFGSKASITIIDLHNPEGHPAGTLVRLLI